MKNIFASLLVALLLLSAVVAQAQTIRRVNNTGTAVTGVNVYNTLQAAHDASSSGDIIYLEPSGISYGDLICVRPLTIIGNGYFLQQNAGLQLDTREAIVGNVYFNSGSAGSRITGCTIQASYLGINASNIVVERNQLNITTYIGYSPQTGLYASVSGIVFRQNYVTSTLYVNPNASTTVSNVNITNNIFATASISSSAQYARMSNILISNNVIGNINSVTAGYVIDIDNAVIKNNILVYTGTAVNFTPRNNAYSYNISGNAALGTANGNQQNVSPANLFVGGTASNDGAYQLRTGSPAIGTGESGTDVGAFGGAIPYRLSGIPNVPTIYQYNQSVSGNTLNATISTRSNN